PEDTWFIAGEHNTTTDHVTLFDLEELPESHRPDVLQLQQDLETARLLNAQERLARLPGAPSWSSPQAAARHVGQVSRDWAQVRPEWGLSSNAAFIIGRRSLTRGLKLDGRAFLHNYDQSQDETGRVLEAIMTAPLVVVQMINFQYYFSATDSWAYGSGTKVLHNVVSGVGVMLGRHSDLQTGFPFQALTTGARRFHEPLRLLAVIEADTGRISQIISRHVVLQNFFENQWIYLVSCHPTTESFRSISQEEPGTRFHHRYHGDERGIHSYPGISFCRLPDHRAGQPVVRRDEPSAGNPGGLRLIHPLGPCLCRRIPKRSQIDPVIYPYQIRQSDRRSRSLRRRNHGAAAAPRHRGEQPRPCLFQSIHAGGPALRPLLRADRAFYLCHGHAGHGRESVYVIHVLG